MLQNTNSKYFFMMTILLSTWVVSRAYSQHEIRTIEIAYHKTSSIVFPAVIKFVDRGSRDVLAQKAKGVDNVLQLKAARENFPETNLTVITADGTLHQFTVNYSLEPGTLALDLSGPQNATSRQTLPLIFHTEVTESDMEEHARKIVSTKRIRLMNERRHKISLSLNGIYIKENVIFYHLRVRNQSNIRYDVDFLRFSIQDKAKMKRTAIQEVDVNPIYVYGDNQTIRSRSTQDIVYALEKFTIPEAKYLSVEMFEKNGGRNLNLFIKNRRIVNARLVE